ncbi:MAG: 30S ribosomal protein S6 [Rikenellaceae bacterium]
MNTYETVFIASSLLAETALTEVISKFQGILSENGATVEHTENWGLRKLAYPIAKKTTGYYFLMQFSAENGTIVEKLETAYRRDEKIVRFLTFRLDKDALEYAAKRREKLNLNK